MKIAIIMVLFIILYCLGSSLYYMLSRHHDSAGVIKALTWRIGLSISLFIFLIVAHYFGWIDPHNPHLLR